MMSVVIGQCPNLTIGAQKRRCLAKTVYWGTILWLLGLQFAYEDYNPIQ